MITKLLVANRGEIARRVMRSAHAMCITCVAVCSDADVGAPHVAEADEVVHLTGNTPAETYLRSDLLVAAARSSGADAVHPGYGFLSEDAAFARACLDAGLVFVGPPPEVIEAMGSKLAAKATMAGAGVPVLPTVRIPHGTGEHEQAAGGVVEGSLDEGGPIEHNLVEADLIRAATELGWPVLVKASAGGGGRGMRVVEQPDELAEAVSSAAREAHSAFGDGTVFLEPYITRPRHVEVQILGDAHGNVVHLFERECSIQRRHQKIVEECPSPALSPELRTEMCTTAVAAAYAIGYVGAGTVEFLLLPDGRFAFLEVNTRLQVEHPVTEMVTGLDLVRLQLLVAEGHALPPEVLNATVRGHAIEVRLYAEDATHSWRPSAGHLHRFSVTGGPDVRVDSGVEDGSDVSPYYDPMVAKVIAHGQTRHEAARTLARVLATAQIHGVTTNRDLLVRILRHPEFLSGDIDTGFLQRHDPAELGRPLATPAVEQVHALAAAVTGQADRRRQAPVLGGLPSGWRNIWSQMQTSSYLGHGDQINIGYRFDRTGRCAAVSVNGARRGDVEVMSCDVDAAVIAVDAVLRHYRVHRVGATTWVDGPDGCSVLAEVPRFPLPGSQLVAGALVAPLPGTVVKVAVSVGDVVSAGDTLIAIEAMKMEHEVRSAVDGTVTEIHVAAGEQVEAGRLLAVVEAQDIGGDEDMAG
ncbi:MAG TPA: biotin carboxylase N-terminal domain-containing protein [Acidimicrobiales bacterium]|nr:biotin carboxylase N-terminal domain-containing protein [Acidimicrobiales bacterium]